MTARRGQPTTVPCPSCGSALGAAVPPACPSCGARVGGDTGRRLVTVDQRIAELSAERSQLLVRLHAEAAVGVDWSVRSAPDAASSVAAAGEADDTGELSGVRGWLATAGPQTLLASSGVLLLAIAAVVFAAVTWRDLSTLTRGGVLLIASTVSAQLTRALVRRGLRRSAEATGVLTVALLAVLLNGLWRAGLLNWVGDALVLTVAMALLAAVAHALASVTTVRSALVLAAWLGPAAVVSGGRPLADAASRIDLPMLAPPLALAAVLAGAVVGAVYADRFLADLTIWRDVTQVAAALLWLVAVIGTAIVLAEPFSSPPRVVAFVVTLLLVGAAVLAAASARRLSGPARRWEAVGVAGMWFAATIGGSAALLDRVELWPDATVVVPLIAGAAALRLLRRRRTRVWAVAGMGPVTLMALTPVLAVIAWLSEILSVRVDAPWTQIVLATDIAQRAPHSATVMSAAVVVAVTAVLAARIGRAAAAALYAATVGGLLAVAAGVLVWPTAGGAIVGVILVACAAGGLRVASRPLPVAVALVAASGVTAMVALSTAAVTIATLAAMAAVSTVALPEPAGRTRAITAAVVTADLIGLVAAIVAATTEGYGPVGVAVALAAACGWVVACMTRNPVRALAVEATAGAAFACAIGTAAQAPAIWPAAVFGVLAVAAAGVAVWRDDRAWLQWVAAASASASSWALLSDYDVRLVEAYTMPPAVLIVALAASGLRARPTGSSWPVMGTGLTLLTMPTVLQLLDDPADLRRLAIAVALGSALVVIGRIMALQSPLAVGVGVLVLAALSQYDVLTDLLPRWMLLAAAGTLLLWLSISYERQRARVSAATRRLVAMR